jgi:adenylate cyclase
MLDVVTTARRKAPLSRKPQSRDRELAEARDQRRATSEILRVIADSRTDAQPVFDTIVRSAVSLCGSLFANVFRFDGELLHFAASHNVGPSYVELLRAKYPMRPDRSQISGRVLLTRSVVRLDDVLADPDYDRRFPATLTWRRMLGVPMLRGDDPVGAIVVGWAEAGPVPKAQEELLRTFADQAVIAIENARLFRELQDASRRLAAQADELAQWNTTLEQRVRAQVEQLERLGRLKRFFSPQLAELIVAGGAEDPLRSHRRDITVVFLDLRGFTAFAETAEPEEVMGVLREYHAAMGELVLAHEGTLERFTGDGMMVFFNDPVPVPNAAERAVRMALAMRDRIGGLAAQWRKRGYPLDFGVGIADGYATIGAIGFEGRWDYGAIGTVTNLASRLCAEAKPGQVLVAQRLLAAVEDLVETEPVGELALRGFQRPVAAYNVVRLREPA